MDRSWELHESPFKPQNLGHWETLFTIGNGYTGTRGTFEEGYPGEEQLFLIHGLFNRPDDTSVPELAEAPAWFALDITINGTPFRLDRGVLLGYQRSLSLRNGVLRRAVLWQSPDGAICRLNFERFASLADQHLLALRMELQALKGSAQVHVLSHWGDLSPHHWAAVEAGSTSEAEAYLVAQTTRALYRLAMATYIEAEGGAAALSSDRERPASKVSFTLQPGESITLVRFSTVYTSRDTDQPLQMARKALQKAIKRGYARLYRDHTTAWEDVWQYADVQIEGDDFAQLAIRFALYHLIIAAPRHDERVSIGAKTLSGRGYKGHVFWDTELFALTPFIYTLPDVARNLLMYRYHLLPGARAKAREEGYEGAMYPWESADTGEETTPKWSDPHPETGAQERIWTGDREIHISADIAYAVYRYWQATGDDAFMARYGAEIILDTAVFWGSRAEYNADADRYELTHVIGPDEYHEDVNNSVFTNAMARWHLQTAVAVLDWLKGHDSEQADDLITRLDLSAQRLAHWQHVIDHMTIPRRGDVLVQFDGFFDLEPVDVQAYWPRTFSLQTILGTEAVNRMQIIKQADVIMLLTLLGEALGSPEMWRANWDVYMPRCDHGSSLSAATHGLMAARLGLVDEAYAFWRQAAGVDLEDNKGNTADGIHAAAAGGLWQATVFGFAGLRIDGGGITFDPCLPVHWQRLSFTIVHRGEVHRVVITPDSTQVS